MADPSNISWRRIARLADLHANPHAPACLKSLRAHNVASACSAITTNAQVTTVEGGKHQLDQARDGPNAGRIKATLLCQHLTKGHQFDTTARGLTITPQDCQSI